MRKKVIYTPHAPDAIGTYSQAIQVDDTVYLSGQIALHPETMVLAEGIEAQIHQVFHNLRCVAESAGGSLKDVVKLTVYLVDLADFATVNEIMAKYVASPYPARAVVQVSALPRGALVEIDGVLKLG